MRLLTALRPTIGVGVDVVGVVEALGDDVHDLSVGQAVWGILPSAAVLAVPGTAAEFIAMDAKRLGAAPVGLEPAAAVAVLVGGVTSVSALFEHGGLRAGQRVLVRGAAGGVGYVAVQLARAARAHVTALVRGPLATAITDLGADDVLDYRTTQPADLGRFDVVLDTAGGPAFKKFTPLVAPGGRMITISPDSPAALVALATRRVTFPTRATRRADLAVLSGHVERGELRPVIASSHPLAQIAQAHQAMEAGGALGKHVVAVS